MNAAPGETIVEQFGSTGFQAVQTSEPTWKRKPFVVDHIFHNPLLKCINRHVVPTNVSDHHALVADFEFAQA
jgi:endonuclease/exonuclease/phosphatase (EEP) superfamily protein YafD